MHVFAYSTPAFLGQITHCRCYIPSLAAMEAKLFSLHSSHPINSDSTLLPPPTTISNHGTSLFIRSQNRRLRKMRSRNKCVRSSDERLGAERQKLNCGLHCIIIS